MMGFRKLASANEQTPSQTTPSICELQAFKLTFSPLHRRGLIMLEHDTPS